MKNLFANSVRPLGIVILSMLGFLLIITFYTNENRLVYSGEEMHRLMTETAYELDSAAAAQLPQALWVSLDGLDAWTKNPREGAVRKPLPSLLNPENEAFWKQPTPKILFATEQAEAYQAWVLLTQLGYQQLYVLKAPAGKSAQVGP